MLQFDKKMLAILKLWKIHPLFFGKKNLFGGAKNTSKSNFKNLKRHKHAWYHKLLNKVWMAYIGAMVAEFTRDKLRGLELDFQTSNKLLH